MSILINDLRTGRWNSKSKMAERLSIEEYNKYH